MKHLIHAILLSAGLVAASHADSGPIQFRFNPPDSVQFVTTTSTVRTRFADSTVLSADTSRIAARLKIRRSGSGYRVTSVPVSITPHGDSAKGGDMIERLMAGTQITLKLDSTGMATEVSGYEALFNKIDSLADPSKLAILKKAVKPEMLASKDKSDWNGRMSRLAGRTIAIGTIDHENTQFTLDRKQLRLFITHEVADTFRIANKLCARVVTITDSDPTHLARQLQKRVLNVATMLNLSDSELTALSNAPSAYFARSELVVEVNTMLVHSETANREIRRAPESGVGGPAVGSRMTEITRKEFDYSSK